jgi:hypothetical protein
MLFTTPPLAAQPDATAAAPATFCEWSPPETATTVRVRTAGELQRAIATAKPDTTILLEDGLYRIDRMLDIKAPGVVIRGRSGDRSAVVVRGNGMGDRRVGVVFSISAPDVTIADLTAGYVGFHGVQIRGERGASRATVQNVHIIDTGQQLIKGSTAGGPSYADDGVIACSLLEYSDHAPSSYTHGVDVIAASGWTVRDNTFSRIRGPAEQQWAAGPAILFWGNSQLTTIERNVIVDSFRGIALGLGPGASARSRDGERSYDHQGGRIRQNVIVNLHDWADEGIEINAARDVEVDHNTVFVEGRLPWSISVRFPVSSGHVRNNLSNRPIHFRDDGHADLGGNVEGAELGWFADVTAAQVTLSQPDLPAVDVGVPVPDLPLDMAGRTRVSGQAPDAGAYEQAGASP